MAAFVSTNLDEFMKANVDDNGVSYVWMRCICIGNHHESFDSRKANEGFTLVSAVRQRNGLVA